MKIPTRFSHVKNLRPAFFAALALTTFAGAGVAYAQMIDLNGNGISDVWEQMYNAIGASPTADADGDGFSNLQEAVAGTNPFNASSYPRIPNVLSTTTNFSVIMPCSLGKVYQLQSITQLGSTNWVTETNVEAMSGTNIVLTAPVTTTMKFYRVSISDTNSDGTGLMNDWEKFALGLNPTNFYSNNQQDANGVAMTDYAYATNLLASQNIITIAATDPSATQPDPGVAAPSTGQYTITRGGFPLNAITVSLATGGPGAGFATAGVDYSTLPSVVTLSAGTSSQTITLTPLANTNLAVPVIAQLKLMSGSNYSVGAQSNADVVIYPSSTALGNGLFGQYFTNSSTTYTNTNNFNPTNLMQTRIDPAIDFIWTNGMTPNISNGMWSVRWTGQVQPQFSETYTFDVRSADGCKLWVNDQLVIDNWVKQSVLDKTTNIALQAGIRYDIKLEYFRTNAAPQVHLSWYSPSQPSNIIPSSCLYPSNSAGLGISNAPSQITSALSAVAFLGQPFTFTVTAANTPLKFTATNLPPGLVLNATNGIISGIPTVAGDFPVMLTSSNAIGIGASLLDILVLNTGSSVVQEIWTNAPGTNIADIPLSTPANITNVLGTLEGTVNYGDNYAERVRGYFTAPVTGNYYFWIAGSDSAELWISNDGDQVNQVRRCYVTPTNNPTASGQNGTTSRQWTLQANQQSGWLTLTGGQKYFIQVLHKAGVGTGDNWSVGWLQDPTGTNSAPAGVTPNYFLSRYYPPLPSSTPGTLYTANLLAMNGVTSQGVGSATLRVSADGTQAVLNYSFTNLVGLPTGQAIDSDPYLAAPSELIYDISASRPQANGSYLWKITPTGPLAAADILQIISQGSAYIVIESTAFPNGEIGGHFTLANGTQVFTPPPAPPAWTDDSANTNAAVRFLSQATFGASPSDLATVQSLGYAGWIANQFTIPATHALTNVIANALADPTDPYPSADWFNTWWQNSITAPDQLRQRVAFALSEIFVISENGTLVNRADALSSYYDTLVDNAFGNFRTLLEAVTLHPGMGLYLNMQGNAKGSIITGIHANENYGREIQQLFSVGLNRLWPDGSLVLNSQGALVPTYNQNTVMGYASVFTGWNYYQTNQANGRLPLGFGPAANYTNPMVLVPSQHELGTKMLLDNVMLPAAQGNAANSGLTNYDYYCSQDLEAAMNSLFINQNVGPFICRQLIQRLVTSDPDPGYIYRVVKVFNNDGTGVRGNLQAVVQAILLDFAARSPLQLTDPTYGKQREPLMRITSLARAFPTVNILTGTYTESGSQTITVTMPSAELLGPGDTVTLTFTDTSGNPAPPTQNYGVTVVSSNVFTVSAPNMLTGSYTQASNVITVNVGGNGLLPGNAAYLAFTTGGAQNGLYSVVATNTTTQFTVATPDGFTRSGNVLLPKISAAGYTVATGTNITVDCSGPHALITNQTFYVPANTVLIPPGQYQVKTIPDPLHFTFATTNTLTQAQSGFTIYPLGPPPLTRSGTVILEENTWNMGYTDGGTGTSLSQSPLRSPTVFNFFYPGYEFPGVLASAGLTTPEFQLTTDSGVAAQMNYIESGVLGTTNNTNGLSSFTGGSSGGAGAIVLNLSPWMTTNYTLNAGIPTLVSNLNTLLVAGQLSPSAQTSIINYIASTNFPYTNAPNQVQMRDRVRAAVHLIVSSPDYMIQK